MAGRVRTAMADGAGIDGAVHQEPLMGVVPVAERELPALLEALLLVAPDPVAIGDLAAGAGVDREAIAAALGRLEEQDDRGWVVVRHHDTVHLATAPRFAPQVRRFLGLEREARLSGAALETLALIAYRQPVTRAEIESLRGVDCAGVLSTLNARGLIEVAGRLPTVGNPNQYGTTVEFLRQFGLQSLADLPPLDELARGAVDRLVAEYPAAARSAGANGEDGGIAAP